MDKHLISNVASSGINMAMNAVMYVYINKRLDSINKKLDALLERSCNNMTNYQAADYSRATITAAAPAPTLPPPPQVAQQVAQTKNMAHTISNMADRILSGTNKNDPHDAIEQRINNQSLVAMAEINQELEDLKEEEACE